jgi:hypothetical protein
MFNTMKYEMVTNMQKNLTLQQSYRVKSIPFHLYVLTIDDKLLRSKKYSLILIIMLKHDGLLQSFKYSILPHKGKKTNSIQSFNIRQP